MLIIKCQKNRYNLIVKFFFGLFFTHILSNEINRILETNRILIDNVQIFNLNYGSYRRT
jgi:hypothetical protein